MGLLGGDLVDIWHRLGRIFRLANLGTLIFFILNISVLLLFFCPNGVTFESASPIVIAYLLTVLISLSPVGEWGLALLAGAREIKRKDIQIRLIPLLEIVYNKAKEKTPYMVNSIHLKIIYDSSPNAFAIGRRTICVTEGLLQLSDNEIMGVLAHEMGHLAYGHTTIQLLIGGGNLFISGCLCIIRVMCWIITGFISLIAGMVTRSFWVGTFTALISSLSAGMVWLWTKFCMLFLMWSMRQNEYIADEYACKIGFGDELAYVLDNALCSNPNSGLLKALYSTHPSTDDRIARMQSTELVNYSRY